MAHRATNSVTTQVHCEPVFADLPERESADRELLRQFESSTLPKARWNHAAHVKVAFLYLRDHPFEVALARLRSGIQAFNAANQVPDNELEGYNETTTCAFLRLIQATRVVYAAVYPRMPSPSARRTRNG